MPGPASHRSAPLAAGLGLLLAGCSLSSDPAADSVGRAARAQRSAAGARLGPPVSGAPKIEVTAPVEPRFDDDRYEVRAGVLNVAFSTTGNHNLNLAGPGIPDPLLWGEDAGAVEDRLTYSVTLRRGEYLFWCSVQGHRAAGMEGRIVAT